MSAEMIKSNFRCTKCKGEECVVGDMAATGRGISRYFNVQVNQFTTVSCSKCGYTEFYKENISGKLTNADWFDIFIGS